MERTVSLSLQDPRQLHTVGSNQTKEYAQLMEAVDHATNYDSTLCLVLLGYQDHTDNLLSLLSEEQNWLLYGTDWSKGTGGVGGASRLETLSSS